MKKHIWIPVLILLVMATFTGCITLVRVDSPPIDAPAPEQTSEPAEVPATTQATLPNETETEGAAASYYIDEVYFQQIGRYHTALSEKWEEGTYFDRGLSALPVYYYEGNPLENVGFGFVDLDNDGSLELVIGAILHAQLDPAVFEVWTLVDGEPVMLAQGGSRNRYVLQYVEEDRMWYVVNEGSNNAANSATYYLTLNEGKLQVVQGIVFDALADEQNPWFLTYDLDWDTSNDTPIDEATANAILESNREHYAAPEYFPYTLF